MPFDPGLILLALAPVFIGLIIWEMWYWRKRNPDMYSLADVFSNASLAAMHQMADGLFLLVFVKSVYQWCYEHGLRAFPEISAVNVFILFLAQDFLYYWFHRAHHRIRWMWSSHVVHHSSERLNFSTAMRQSLTYPLSLMWAFWIPLALIGFTPDLVILIVGLNLAFQFFVHTQVVNKLGVLEWILNTPSHHRAHHARNSQYIDKNYAGVLIIWDRLFGTFEPEVAAPDYGIAQRQVRSHNPLLLTFHEWRDMFRDVIRDRDLRHLWMPPEWAEKKSGASPLDQG